MELQCSGSLLHNRVSAPKFSPFQFHSASPSSSLEKQYKSHARLREQTPLLRYELKLNTWLRNGAIVCQSKLNSSNEFSSSAKENSDVPASDISGLEPFRGKSGSVSLVGIVGLIHELVEETISDLASFIPNCLLLWKKLDPFNWLKNEIQSRLLLRRKLDLFNWLKRVNQSWLLLRNKAGPFLWVVAPVALISAFLLPQFLIDIATAIGDIKNEVFLEILASFITVVLFYIGVGIYLFITVLRGYSTSASRVLGFRTIVPVGGLSITWPVLGTEALVALVPFSVSCLGQLAFERYLEQSGSSCWPSWNIIFQLIVIYNIICVI